MPEDARDHEAYVLLAQSDWLRFHQENSIGDRAVFAAGPNVTLKDLRPGDMVYFRMANHTPAMVYLRGQLTAIDVVNASEAWGRFDKQLGAPSESAWQEISSQLPAVKNAGRLAAIQFERLEKPPASINLDRYGINTIRHTRGRYLTRTESGLLDELFASDNPTQSSAGTYAVISENDISEWDDQTGVRYHFPSRYRDMLLPGTQVIYYKGKQRAKRFENLRLSALPHYFGAARIGDLNTDPKSEKNDLYAEILDFQYFSQAVLANQEDGFIEQIPDSRVSNFWRDGVRKIEAEQFHQICKLAGVDPSEPVNDANSGLSSSAEGAPSYRYVTTYERIPALRTKAIEIHGLACMICGFDFSEHWGEHGDGFIHIHHLKPVSEANGYQLTDPKEDLRPVCPNCHAMIHRKRKHTLSIEEARSLYQVKPR